MSEWVRKSWLRECALRRGGQVLALALGLTSSVLGPWVLAVAGIVVGVWALADGLSGRVAVEE